MLMEIINAIHAQASRQARMQASARFADAQASENASLSPLVFSPRQLRLAGAAGARPSPSATRSGRRPRGARRPAGPGGSSGGLRLDARRARRQTLPPRSEKRSSACDDFRARYLSPRRVPRERRPTSRAAACFFESTSYAWRSSSRASMALILRR